MVNIELGVKSEGLRVLGERSGCFPTRLVPCESLRVDQNGVSAQRNRLEYGTSRRRHRFTWKQLLVGCNQRIVNLGDSQQPHWQW